MFIYLDHNASRRHDVEFLVGKLREFVNKLSAVIRQAAL
jgi:hypothetical protein